MKKQKKPQKADAAKESGLSEFLKAKQERQKNNFFAGGSTKGSQGVKPRIWNRKQGM